MKKKEKKITLISKLQYMIIKKHRKSALFKLN